MNHIQILCDRWLPTSSYALVTIYVVVVLLRGKLWRTCCLIRHLTSFTLDMRYTLWNIKSSARPAGEVKTVPRSCFRM